MLVYKTLCWPSLYYSRSVSLSAAKIPCPSWDRPSPFVACLARQSAARKTTKTDRLSHSDHAARLRLAAMWGGQFCPQPALAGCSCPREPSHPALLLLARRGRGFLHLGRSFLQIVHRL